MMKETIKAIIEQARDEQNWDLIRNVNEILEEFEDTLNCPDEWRKIKEEIAEEYQGDEWVAEGLDLSD